MPETERQILLARILNARHDPDEIQALLQDLVDEGAQEVPAACLRRKCPFGRLH